MVNFWKDKKVLITGAFGFVGKHLTNRLNLLQAQVFLVGHKNTGNIKTKNIFIGDVANNDFIDKIFKKNNFDYCFHLAAQSQVSKASDCPRLTFDTNIKGAWNILDAAKQNKLIGLIIASTTHVYGQNKLPFKEEYPPHFSRPYETSKACTDILAQSYATYYKLPIAIARFTNIYGPCDNHNRLIPHTIRLLLQNKQPELFYKQTVRDYLYIDDAISGYLTLAEKMIDLKKNEINIIFNFGTGKHYTNKQVIAKIIKLMHKTKIQPKIIEGRFQEIDKQYVSISKAKKILNWQPKISLTEGLKTTIASAELD